MNAPETYLVEIVDVGTDADNILDILYRTIEKDEQDFSTIRDLVDGKVVFSYGDDFIYCIFQEKIGGINIFKQDWSLEEYLEYYNSIPVEHYEKFILDAHKISHKFLDTLPSSQESPSSPLHNRYPAIDPPTLPIPDSPLGKAIKLCENLSVLH